MKHPKELDLHDLDKMRIAELEMEVTELTFDLEAARDEATQLRVQLEDCEENLGIGC